MCQTIVAGEGVLSSVVCSTQTATLLLSEMYLNRISAATQALAANEIANGSATTYIIRLWNILFGFVQFHSISFTCPNRVFYFYAMRPFLSCGMLHWTSAHDFTMQSLTFIFILTFCKEMNACVLRCLHMSLFVPCTKSNRSTFRKFSAEY